MIYAYGRVSAADQNPNRQIDSFIQFGVNIQQIYTDKKSGKDFERENYRQLKSLLRSGAITWEEAPERTGMKKNRLFTVG